MGAYDIQIDRRRNRIYFCTPPGIYPSGAQREGDRWWYGVARMTARGLATMLDGLVAERDRIAESKTAYDTTLAEIPADYRRRHGALLGGAVTIDGEAFAVIVPVLGWLQTAAPWEQLAEHVSAYGHTGLCAGRVMDRDTLSRAVCGDGRPVYREIHYRGFGDDQRETYHLPLDLFAAVCRIEAKARAISRESAREWLAEYRGCVGTELYEFIAEPPLGPG
jgi:hypothetical protein